MARRNFLDFLQAHTFWLTDVAPIEPLALPVFTPLFGFSTISSPEITLDTQEIAEANAHYKRKVVTHGDVGNITMTRGASFADSDFYRWTMTALHGDTAAFGGNKYGAGGIGGPTPRRSLVLIQLFPRNPLTAVSGTALSVAASLATTTLVTSAAIASGSALGATQAAANVAAASTPFVGPFYAAPRVPARAWLLHGCLPVRYKAGSDFDANSSEVSMMELEVAVEGVEEISLAT